ncbi:hypothetical protein AB0I84_12390 [Streptomyces spectabilis]|uniref:hypothetical protein n=1 Tax=Streptomyces spectabilis TaxID=68270 RepID=UPI0033E1C3D5
MTRLPTPSRQDSGRVVRAISRPGLIRLVSELDDHGPISRRRGSLQAAFDDLTTDQLRLAIDRACAFGLVHGDEDERVRYRLTPRGEDLADVYDAAARWARTHQYPTHVADFVTRVEHTLTLLGQTLATGCEASRTGEAGGLPVSGGPALTRLALTGLHGPRSALETWLRHTTAFRLHTVDEKEPAA